MEIITELGKEHGHPGNDHEVMVMLDGSTRKIRRGTYSITELKRLFRIDSCRDLDELICGELRPLEDIMTTHIEGGETFVSHVRCGGSS
jgi:hypothetical protein